MDAAGVLIGLAAQSLAEAEVSITVPQLRVLVTVSRNGPLNLNAVAAMLGVHPSNATRTCQRLVEARTEPEMSMTRLCSLRTAETM